MSTTVRISTPGELAGTIPYLLGFTPDQGSLVYLSLGKGPIARLDMTDDVRDAIDMLQPMWDQHPPEQAALVFYTSDPRQALLHASGFTGEVQRRGGAVVAAIRVHDGVCQHVSGDETEHPIDTAPPAAAPFVAKGVAPLANREASEARLTTDERPIRALNFEVALDTMKIRGKAALHQAAQDLLASMHRYLEDGTLPTDKVIPTFALALQAKQVRDIAWAQLTRANASRFVEFFLHMYRRCPQAMTAPICGLIGFAAWLDGTQSPLAWAAAEKALEVEPGYTMAEIVIQGLRYAVSPEGWTPLGDDAIERIWESLR